MAISDVKFIDFRGTTPNEKAITLDCSKIKPCRNIVMNEIDITTDDKKKKTKVDCNYMMGNSDYFKE